MQAEIQPAPRGARWVLELVKSGGYYDAVESLARMDDKESSEISEGLRPIGWDVPLSGNAGD